MPRTVNGVGTHYYGRKNAETRAAVCQSCGAETELMTFDTRLWFVVIYVPLIPLGRKKIIDLCPCCQRHWTANEHEWEMSKQLGVSGAMERYRSDPTPESALDAHGYLVNYRQHEEAAELRDECLGRFPGQAPLMAGLGQHLDQIGRHTEAAELYEQALELRPDLPEARFGAAADRLAQGKLDEARELLDFLVQPGAGQLYDLSPLEQLAVAYQQHGKHRQTIELCEHLIAEFPDAAQQYRFRQFVAASESAIDSKPSVLPKREFSLKALFQPSSGRYSSRARWTVTGAIAALFIAIGLMGNNEYHRRNRTLHVVNGFNAPVQVKVGDQEPIVVQTRGRITVCEGEYDVRISGPIEETVEVQLKTPYFQRWTHKPVWVVNPGGAAALSRHLIVYSEYSRPAAMQILLGKRFYFAPHVDYLFEKPPRTMKMSRGGSTTKISLEEAPLSPVGAFRYAYSQRSYDEALEFAESHLAVRRDDQPFLFEYVKASEGIGKREHVLAFLKSKLWARPLSVPWHRTYVNTAPVETCEGELLASYEKEIQKSATAKLLYLRALVTPSYGAAKESTQQAQDADPKLGWPGFSLGVDRASRADWAGARVFFDETHAINPHNDEWRDMRYLVRLAQGNVDELLEEFVDRDRDILSICEVLIVAGRIDDARDAEQAWLHRLPASLRGAPGIQALQQRMRYMRGEFAQTLSSEPYFEAHALFALSRPDEAVDALKTLPAMSPWDALAAHLTFSLEGDVESAKEWRQTALSGLERGRSNQRRAADALRAIAPPTSEQLDQIVLHPSYKALVCAVLAQTHETNPEFAKLAGELNVRRYPPYHLVKRAVSAP